MNKLICAMTLLVALPAVAQDYDLNTDQRRTEVVDEDGMSWRLARESSSTVIDATPERVWAELANYGSVKHISATITESAYIDGSTEVKEGCARSCHLVFGGRDIDIKERIIHIDPGKYYTYDVYDFVNFPAKKMHVSFAVHTNEAGKTVLTNIVDFRMKPGMMTGMARGQMRRSAENTVLGYKHYLETGVGNLSRKELTKLYASR